MPSNSPDCFGLDVLQLVRQNNEMVEWISQLNTKTLIFEKLPIAHGTLKHSLLALKAENASLVNQLIY